MRHALFERDDPFDDADLRDRLYSVLQQLDRVAASFPTTAHAPTAKRVLSIVKARRLRDRFFDADLFADPAWDMLLDLYASELDGFRTSVSSLCIGAAVPATTALRWIKSLETGGLLQRMRDPLDARRTFMALTPRAREAMEALLKASPPAETLF
jgi:hypothetical protein